MDRIGRMQGVVRLVMRYASDAKMVVTMGRNLIVASGNHALLAGLSGTSDKYIDKVQMGSNANAAVAGDVAITSPVDLAIVSKTVVGTKLVITFEVGANDGNGRTISEFGLICKDGTLFARKVFPPFSKIQDLTIKGTWEIRL